MKGDDCKMATKNSIMQRDPSYFKHLPEYYHDVQEIFALAKTIDEELKDQTNTSHQDLQELFVMTASANTLEVWESELGIRADPSKEDLNFRKKRLINRYTTKPPFTMRWLENQLQQLLGNGFIKIKRDDEIELLTIFADLSSLNILREFDLTLERILPLSMQYFKSVIAKMEAVGTLFVKTATMTHIAINPQHSSTKAG